MQPGAPLQCPRCGAAQEGQERFCAACGMPLVERDRAEGEERVGSARDRARKVRPQYARGEPVKVAWGRNQAEAELIQGLLLEEGVPSVVRRAPGFDVPDFLAGGPRDILVPESGVEAAREILAGPQGADHPSRAGTRPGGPSPVRLAAWILVALALGSVLLAVLYAASG